MKSVFCSSKLIGIVLFISGCALPVKEESLQKFVPNSELATVSLVREGLQLLSKNRYGEAEGKFRQALYIFPQAVPVRANLAAALGSMGLYEDSEQIYLDLLKEDQESNSLLMSLANMYLQQELDKAKQVYFRALQLAEDKDQPHLRMVVARNLAVLNFRMGDEEDARCYSEMSYAIQQDPNERFRHARLLVALGYYSETEDLLTKVVEERGVDLVDPRVLHQLGIAMYGLGKFKEVFNIQDLLVGVRLPDRSLVEELQLYRELNERSLSTKESNSSEQLDEGAIEPFSGKPLESLTALYWPFNALVELQKIEEEKLIKDEQ